MGTGMVGRLMLAALGWVSLTTAAIAVTFDQQEIDQSRLIPIAAPAGDIGFQLLILEQIDDSRPCWSEAGSAPTLVEPLLLQFDFTGICGRKTDSNGYSLRLAGQDLGLQYQLQVLQQANDLVLAAVPTTDRRAPMIEIGRTYGMANGFSRIVLNPGWRLTRRVYQGRPTGHLYLTNDASLADLAAASAIGSSSQPTASPAAIAIPVPPPLTQSTQSTQSTQATWPTAAPTPTMAIEIPVPPPSPPTAAAPAVTIPVPAADRGSSATGSDAPPPLPSAATTVDRSLAASTGATAISSWYQVVVDADSADLQDRVRAIAPSTLLITMNDQVVIQAGVFRDRESAEQLQQQLMREGLRALVLPIR